ncbi:TIR domain-containing protein [Paracoccus versutus]|uniref:TIR domain-containing protein n=1 Tax=Paracoccus versutus TaxID=34007 RepID=UPI000DF75ED5|nr:TIR domain-containing protein [Paracoccus versutus]RDD70842.1 TIR domain-containing protein [Paracoccus versutus]
MPCDFSALSAAQFEYLSADLIGRDKGIRFEQFGAGPDGGMDGRHARGPDTTILQAKHYEGSGFSELTRVLRNSRLAIDKMAPSRYILSTSVSMSPDRKEKLMDIIGPSLLEPGDIYGREDLAGLLRQYPAVLNEHPALWQTGATVLETVLNRTLDERERRTKPPEVLASLLPRTLTEPGEAQEPPRDVIFLLGSRPGDDPFILWLGPKLEAHGYHVFSELLTLEPGDRWRKEVYRALEHRAIKVLVPVGPATRGDDGLMDLVDKAAELAQTLGDPRFIIPLRMEDNARIEGMRDTVPVDFSRGWGKGLDRLLTALRSQKLPCDTAEIVVANQWEAFRVRQAIPIVREPETLTSNWVPVVEMPDQIHFYEAVGALHEDALKRQVSRLTYPAVQHGRGLIVFADPHDIAESFDGIASLRLRASASVTDFVESGIPEIGLKGRDASNMMTGMIRDAWERLCRSRGMIAYTYSGSEGFHVSADQVPNGSKVSWGRQGGGRRSSMLRNVARKHLWKYGVTAVPKLWPFWHFRLKARVLFAEDNGTPEGKGIDDPKKMHRLRRSGCQGWRNKQWHGRLLAFLEIMSSGSAFIRVPLAPGHDMVLSSEPVLFTSPVSTRLPDILDADSEETDESTLGRPESEEA